MLYALGGTDYDWLHQKLVIQFLNSKTAPDDKGVIEAINFAGYDQRQHSLEHTILTNISKDESARKKAKCANSNCKSTKHTIHEYWHDGGGAVDKAPDWWKEIQAARKKRPGK